MYNRLRVNICYILTTSSKWFALACKVLRFFRINRKKSRCAGIEHGANL